MNLPQSEEQKKTSRAEYLRNWRLQNKERIAAWRDANKEHLATYKREYNQKNKERVLTKKREWRERTTAQRAKSYREWHDQNRARKYSQNLAWRRTNKERIAEYTRIYADEKPWISLLATARKRCKGSGLEYSLTMEWFKSRWTGRCELSGLELVRGNGKQHMRSPTIDRIDPSKGYTPENCRFVCLALNAMRGDGTDAEMMELLVATLDFQTSRT